MAKHLGYYLERTRQRTIQINNCGEYRLINPFHSLVVLGERFDACLAEIADLEQGPPPFSPRTRIWYSRMHAALSG